MTILLETPPARQAQGEAVKPRRCLHAPRLFKTRRYGGAIVAYTRCRRCGRREVSREPLAASPPAV